MLKGPAPSPCESCPYRRDVPSGVWEASEYAKLLAYDRPVVEQPSVMFLCHLVERVCAGWAGVHGPDDPLALRLAVFAEKVSAEDAQAIVDYESPVPLFSSGAEAGRHGIAEVEDPGEPAKRVIGKVLRTRSRHGSVGP